jgi:outer membrane lipoprotein SlyB
MSKRTLAVGVLIGLAVAGCVAAVTAGDEYIPVEVGVRYCFYHNQTSNYTQDRTGTVVEVWASGWAVLDSGTMVNLRTTQFIRELPAE